MELSDRNSGNGRKHTRNLSMPQHRLFCRRNLAVYCWHRAPRRSAR
jgi:hypothetical protein